MAVVAKDLPIYRATYELLENVMKITKEFPRSYKITLAGKLQEECVGAIMDIYRANVSRERRERGEIVFRILERVQMIELILRLCKDLRIVTIKQHARVVSITDSIGRQATGWAKSSVAGQHSKRQGHEASRAIR